ncbi:hypothetical protein H0H93_006859 [Arthromyces matolae]|nr:hypothetical protein H0H93_006859 [Arthromyces matolae]
MKFINYTILLSLVSLISITTAAPTPDHSYTTNAKSVPHQDLNPRSSEGGVLQNLKPRFWKWIAAAGLGLAAYHGARKLMKSRSLDEDTLENRDVTSGSLSDLD